MRNQPKKVTFSVPNLKWIRHDWSNKILPRSVEPEKEDSRLCKQQTVMGHYHNSSKKSNWTILSCTAGIGSPLPILTVNAYELFSNELPTFSVY